jgi:hypothetical protein
MLDGDPESPSVTTMLGAAGACPEVRHGGKVWKVGHPTQRAKACLEQLAAAQALAEVTVLKGIVPPDQYAELYQSVRDAITARHYKTWGEGWQKIVWGPMSAQLFLLSLVRENHPDATEDDVLAMAGGAPEQVAAALALVVPPFVSLLLSDRKDVTPEQRAAIMGVAERVASQLAPSPPPPAPFPATTAPSSPSGTRASRKSRGALTPTR